mmetsp:Transcript_61620/g.144463  ORF Transcript_61620/g.144463 Transcript_61620/m.144463 type:complete len:83 (+) Transcript_61620:2557-2805(+)
MRRLTKVAILQTHSLSKRPMLGPSPTQSDTERGRGRIKLIMWEDTRHLGPGRSTMEPASGLPRGPWLPEMPLEDSQSSNSWL